MKPNFRKIFIYLNTDSVRTFKEITDLYPGKVIFIDVWATWCGPCRASFAHQTFAEICC